MRLNVLIVGLCCVSGLWSEVPEVVIPGSVTLVGLFAVWDSKDGVCTTDIDVDSVMLIEAVKWYINHLNEYGNLPVSIGFEAYATCRLTTRAADIAVDVVSRRHNNELILGIIGPEYSSEAMAISPVLSSVSIDRRLLQVGFSSTASSLKNRSKYPDYVRVIPNDDFQIETFKSLEWNRIGIVYEDDIYGKECADLLVAKAHEEDICVSNTHNISLTDGVQGVSQQDIMAILNGMILGTNDRPTVNGIVIFASPPVVNKVFLSMQSLGISPLPIVLISESLNMDTNALKQPSGVELSTAYGSLAVSPPYREVTEFADHWKKVLTNITKFGEEVKTNPLLNDVLNALTNLCPSNNVNCDILNEAKVNGRFRKQPLYARYVITAAHALIKGMDVTYRKYCQPGAGMCSTLSENFRFTELQGLDINFGNDFNWSPQSMASPSKTMRFDINGELIGTNSSEPLYTLFNYQKESAENVFDLLKVGDLKLSGFSMNLDHIRDYNNNGEDHSWPNLRKAQCPAKRKCTECYAMKTDSVLYEPGDYYVIGAVPVFNSDEMQGCGTIRTYPGYQVIEAIKKAIEEVNKQNEQTVGSLKIGYIILNTCSNAAVIQRKIYELHYAGVILPNGTKLVLDINKVIGYVGEVNSQVSIAMAEVLTKFPLLHISYASTTDLLSDRESFPNFMRLVAPIRFQGEAVIEIVKHLESDYVQLIYSDTVYGNNGKDDTLMAAVKHKVCVIQSIPFKEGDNPYNVYNKLRKYPHARIVIVFLHSYQIRSVIASVVSQIQQGEFLFLGSQTWHHTSDLLDDDVAQVLLGSYSLGFEIAGDSQLLQRVRNLAPVSPRIDPWSMPFLQARGNCYFNQSYDKTQPYNCHDVDTLQFDLDYLDNYAYFTTKALLKGAMSLLHKQCSATTPSSCLSFAEHRQEFLEEMHRVKLDINGNGIEDYVFDENGDGNVGYRIYNVQKDKFDPSKMVYTPVGRYSHDGTFMLEEDNIVYPTQEPYVSVCPNPLACKICNMTTEEEQEKLNDTRTMDTPMILGIVLAVALAFGAILVVIVIVIFRKYTALKQFQYKDNMAYITPIDILDPNDVEIAPPSPHELIPTTDN